MNVHIPNDTLDSLPLTTYEGFCSWYQGNPKGRQGTFEKIENLKKALNGGDPISYLYSLYFDERKSLIEILATPIVSGVDFVSKATLHRLLFEHLHWLARPKTERTPVHEKQLDTQIQTRILNFETEVSKLLEGKSKERVFNISELQMKTYRIQKSLYILNTLGGIDKETLLTLSQEGGLENATIAHALNKKLKEILELFPLHQINFDEIKLYPQSISRWFEYQKQKNNYQK